MSDTLATTTFRDLQESDLKAVLGLEDANAEEYDEYLGRKVIAESSWGEHDIERALSGKNTRSVAVEEGEWLVGYVIYELEHNGYRLIRMVVHPHARRASIGTAIVNWFLMKAEKSHKRINICACVDERNIGACSFFKKLGFKSKLVRSRRDDLPDDIEFTFQVGVREV